VVNDCVRLGNKESGDLCSGDTPPTKRMTANSRQTSYVTKTELDL
jgi:hypothetical protein